MASCFAFQTDKPCNLKYGHQVLECHLPSPWISTAADLDDDNARAFCAISL